MQLLCTLRNHCRQWPRNTRYQADATPYLGRTSLPPAGSHQLCLAHSLDHLVGSGEHRRRNFEAKRLCGLEIDDELVLGRSLYRQVARLLALEDAIDIARRASEWVDGVGAVRDQAIAGDEAPMPVDRGQSMPVRQRDGDG